MVKKGLEFRFVSPAEAGAHWDQWLGRFKDAHIRQSRGWARLKSPSWQPLFPALFHGPAPVAMALVLIKRTPLGAATLAWINGGPAHQRGRPFSEENRHLRAFLDGLRDGLGRSRLLLRLAGASPMDVRTQLALRQSGFVRPLVPVDTGLTYRVDLDRELDALRGGLERNWRNQLRTAEKQEVSVELGRSRDLLERYLPIHNDMCERKGLPGQKLDMDALLRMTEVLGEGIEFILLSLTGKAACGGAVWRFGEKAWFALSAADEAGRKAYLPNLMYWRLIERLKGSGASIFDLTGIDPDRNWGVFNFKRGLGLEPTENLGEWEWAASPWTRRLFNLAFLKSGL